MIAKSDGKRVKYLSLKYKDYFSEHKSSRRRIYNFNDRPVHVDNELDDNEQALVDRLLAGIE